MFTVGNDDFWIKSAGLGRFSDLDPGLKPPEENHVHKQLISELRIKEMETD